MKKEKKIIVFPQLGHCYGYNFVYIILDNLLVYMYVFSPSELIFHTVGQYAFVSFNYV